MPETSPSPTTATVLVVDDESGVRDVVRRVLLNEGYRVIEASDGLDALRVAEAEAAPLDLLLTDLKMPRMDGRQLADALRKRQQNLKVLFLTAYADNLFADRAMLEENTAYLEKPVSARGLNEAVRLLLYGSLSAGQRDEAQPAKLETPPLATTETEYLRISLPDGGAARLMVTGADPSMADIEEVIGALRRHLDERRTAGR
jgi:CheY-like chemotaxis protein